MTKKFIWILIALVSVRLLMMATTPVFDPSEARYAAISANMARTGDFVVPHFTYKGVYRSFDGKPPLVFQAGGAFCSLFGVHEFSVRLFPFLSAVLLLVILHHTVKRFADRDTARLAVVVCATSTAFFAAAGLAMTDMTLACCVAGALLWYRCYLEDAGKSARANRYVLGIGVLLGAGMIVKGPVALVMFGLPVLADAIFNHHWKALFNWRWLLALPVFLLVAAPWFVLVEQRNPGSVWYFFYNENFLRFVSHDYGDKYGAGREAFRGVAIIWALVSMLPWSLLALPRLRHPSSLKQVEWRDFFFLSGVMITLFWCLTSRVLVYYLFPTIPLFAAWMVMKGNRERLARLAPFAAAISCVVLVGALVGGSLFSEKMQGAKREFSAHGSTYSYEFYHGTHPSALQPK